MNERGRALGLLNVGANEVIAHVHITKTGHLFEKHLKAAA